MGINELPYWLQNTIICGRDNDGNEGEGDEGDEGDDAGDDGEENDGEGEEEISKIDPKNHEARAAALEKALETERKQHREERKLRRKAERDARQAAQQKEESEEAKTLEETQTKLAAEADKNSKLATRLLNNERDAAILAEARRQKFIDPTDALIDDVRNAVEVDQDDEDPSDIEVDSTSVKNAITKLATSKKHLIGEPNEGDRSGSRFRKRGTKDDEATSDEKLKETYPSLR